MVRNGLPTRPGLPKRSRPQGFTLIEVLIVVVIIGLLAAVLLPALAAARFQARTVQGLANLRQIGQGIALYAENQRDLLPIGFYWQDGSPKNTDWGVLLVSLLDGGGSTYQTASLQTTVDANDIRTDPNATIAGGRLHYSAHPVLMPDVSPASALEPYPQSRLRRPAEILLVADGAQDPALGGDAHAVLWQLDGGEWVQSSGEPWYFDATDARNSEPIQPGPNADSAEGVGHIRFRQGQGSSGNILLADGHGETRRPSSVLVRHIRPD